MIWRVIPDMGRRAVLKAGVAGATVAVLPKVALAGPIAGPSPVGDGRGPWCYWYWLDSNITAEGIETDLAAMAQAGIGGVIIFNINGVGPATQLADPPQSHSPAWWALIRLAIRRARDLGISVAMNICDGWGTAGGAWITPDQSAQELVWGDTVVEPGAGGPTMLAQPAARLDYYQDVATYAIPLPDTWLEAGAVVPQVRTSWTVKEPARLLQAGNGNVVEVEDPGWIELTYPAPVTVRSVRLVSQATFVLPFLSIGYSGGAHALEVQASDDGQTFTTIHRLEQPTLGWQANMADMVRSIPPTRARVFRFVYDPVWVRTSNGFDGALSVSSRLMLSALLPSSRPAVDSWPVRSGQAWGHVAPLTDDLVPLADCIDRAAAIDISADVTADHRCTWQPPDDRRWLIRRIGATTNGKTTAPSGRMGGLECDKFNPDAVTLQFDRWFAEALRQTGTDDNGDPLITTVFMDSWEGQGQSWSRHLSADFQARHHRQIGADILALTGLPVGSAAETDGFLFDWRRTIGELVAQNFFGTVAGLAHGHGCRFSAEAANASFPSDGLLNHRHVDLPCGEFWHNRVGSDKPSDIHDAVSAAHIYGHPIIGAEAWTGGLDWTEHPFSFKRQGDEMFCHGVNRMILHVWAHQAFPGRRPGVTLFGFGSFFSHSQTWWPLAQAWVSYLSRCQTQLQQGQPVVDLAVFIGEDVPTRAWRPDRLQSLLPGGYAFDSINADVLVRLAWVQGGRIVLPSGASYAALIIPPDLRMTSPTAQAVGHLRDAGALVLSPVADGDAGRIGGHLLQRGVQPAVEGAAATLAWTHRQEAGRDIFFLSNQGEAPVRQALRFRTGRSAVRLVDPVDETITVPAMRAAGGMASVTIDLEAAGSVFVLFQDAPDAVASISPDTLSLSLAEGRMTAEADRCGEWQVAMGSGAVHDVTVADLPIAHAVEGPWRITFDNTAGSVVDLTGPLRSWTQFNDEAIRHHSGLATYQCRFAVDLPPAVRWHLSLGSLADLASVEVNGVPVGTIWVPGRTLDVTDALHGGDNLLAITVANTWRNRLVGDQRVPAEQRQTYILPNELGRSRARMPAADSPLLPAGLLGPVILQPRMRQTL